MRTFDKAEGLTITPAELTRLDGFFLGKWPQNLDEDCTNLNSQKDCAQQGIPQDSRCPSCILFECMCDDYDKAKEDHEVHSGV